MKAFLLQHRPHAPALYFRKVNFGDLPLPRRTRLRPWSRASEAEPMTLAEKTKGAAAAADKESKLWGGRFEESVTDAVERFGESVSFDKELYKHDIRGSRAHANMLAKQVLLPVLCIL